MHFELSGALISDILFCMEDQDGDFLLDTQEGTIISASEDGTFDTEDAIEGENADVNDDRYISLPEWTPSDGYRLMEHFTAGLHNPDAREKLSSALNSSRGVFRAFKNALGQYPEMEKIWFAFKEREMKKEITGWYNALRESWGLELIGDEPEESDDLVLEDFVIRTGTAADGDAAVKLHRLCLEHASDANCAGRALLESMNPWVFPGDICFTAENAAGEFAGFVSAVCGEALTLQISALETAPRYRGLGLGLALLRRLLAEADAFFLRKDGSGIGRIILDLPAESENFSRALLREAFKPQVQRYCRESR